MCSGRFGVDEMNDAADTDEEGATIFRQPGTSDTLRIAWQDGGDIF